MATEILLEKVVWRYLNRINQSIHGDDDLISNYSFQIGGYNFLEPRFYFSRKNNNTDRDKSDWEGVRKFFEMKSHKGYPFNMLSEDQWGIECLPEM
jgi:hypothetical protein